MTVPLPATGDGTRRQRRQERRRRGRRWQVRVVAAVAVLALGSVGAWAVVDLVRDDDPAASPADGDDGVAAAAPTPSLVVFRDAAIDGDVYGVTILVPATATIVHVAPGTLVDVPSLGLSSLRDAGRSGGAALVQQALENLLGVHFEAVLDVGPDELADLLEPLDPLVVSIDDAVEDRTAAGRVTIVVPSGSQTLTPESVATFLATVGDGTALDRIVRHRAFWDAYLRAANGVEVPLAAIESMAGGEVQQRVLPVEAVAGVEGDEELYRLVDDDLAELIDRVLPGAQPEDERIRVRILNGVGTPGLAQQVQPLLVDAGGRVTLSGNADRFDYQTTQIVYYDDEHLVDAEAIREALGVGEIVRSVPELDVVDVTVVVGADFMAAHPGG